MFPHKVQKQGKYQDSGCSCMGLYLTKLISKVFLKKEDFIIYFTSDF